MSDDFMDQIKRNNREIHDAIDAGNFDADINPAPHQEYISITPKRFILRLLFPAFVIIAACLFSFFPHYEDTYIYVIVWYVIFLLAIFVVAGKAEDAPNRQFRIVLSHYVFAALVLIAIVYMATDLNKYYSFMEGVQKYEAQYNNGEKTASLELAYFYKKNFLSSEDRPSAIEYEDTQKQYKKWLTIYVDEAIKSKNNAAIKQVRELAKINIRGFYGVYFTNDKDTEIGKAYYMAAYALGDTQAPIEMEHQLAAAKIKRRQEEIRQQAYKFQQKILAEQRRRKRLEDEKKSVPEKIGEGWGSFKKGVKDATNKITKPLRDFWNDFEKGERRTNY